MPIFRTASFRLSWLALPLALALAACHGGGKGGEGRARDKQPVPVLAAKVARASVPLAVEAVGTVEAAESVAVRAQVTGTVTAVGFREGAPVKRGQMLFKLDAAPLEAALRQARATLARDRANLAQARADAARGAELAAKGYIARQAGEQAQSSAAALEASVAAGEAQVASAEAQLGYATIVSPIDGVAGARGIYAGNLARAGDATPLVTINQQAPILVRFTIPQNEVARFRRYQHQGGLSVTATPRGGTPQQGALAFVDNAIDPATGTLALKGRFPNAGGELIPGQFADVSLRLALEADRVVAPARALLAGQDGEFAFVIDEAGVARQRAVERERTVGDLAVITGGLAPGEDVVIDGTLQLKDGSPVALRDNLQPPSPDPGKGRRSQP